MKNIKLFNSQTEAISLVCETPLVSTIKGMTEHVLYASSNVGDEVEIIENEDIEGFINYKSNKNYIKLSSVGSGNLIINKDKATCVFTYDEYTYYLLRYSEGDLEIDGIKYYAYDVEGVILLYIKQDLSILSPGHINMDIYLYVDSMEKSIENQDVIILCTGNEVKYELKYQEGENQKIYLQNNSFGIYAYTLEDDIINNTLISIDIPDNIIFLPDYAFSKCINLNYVYIPKSAIYIGLALFDESPNVNTLIIDNENPIYDSRDNCNAIIYTSTNTLIVGCSGTIIPNSILCIARYAFLNCTGLKTINIPNSILYIAQYAFLGCENLNEIRYDGTIELWNSIEKSSYWHEKVPETTVVTCTDGTVSLT